jgi:putative nucleotidyltransferase with HDIG domain
MLLQNKTQKLELISNDNIVMEDLVEAINHGILVSNLAVMLSRELKLDSQFCNRMAQAGMLHDIGKLKLGKSIYGEKKGALVIEEMNQIRMHPTIGYDILKQYDYHESILEAIYHHHENDDGSGYPHNLKGDSIPLGGKILRICDVFAALVSDRPYRAAFDINTAIILMIEEVKNFDMQLFLAFLTLVHSEKFSEIQNFIDTLKEREQQEQHDNNQLECYEIMENMV